MAMPKWERWLPGSLVTVVSTEKGRQTTPDFSQAIASSVWKTLGKTAVYCCLDLAVSGHEQSRAAAIFRRCQCSNLVTLSCQVTKGHVGYRPFSAWLRRIPDSPRIKASFWPVDLARVFIP